MPNLTILNCVCFYMQVSHEFIYPVICTVVMKSFKNQFEISKFLYAGVYCILCFHKH